MTLILPGPGPRAPIDLKSRSFFSFDIADYPTRYLTARTNQLSAFSRASASAAYVDAAGLIKAAIQAEPRFGTMLNPDGVLEPALLLEPAITNVCLQVENFGTTWAAIGTPTRSAAAGSSGDVVLDLIGDDAAGTLEGYSQTITFTGNAKKALSVYWAAGSSTGTVIHGRNTTDSTDWFLAVISAAGVPTMTTGVYLGREGPLANGGYRLLFTTGTVTVAGKTNSLRAYPASNAALTVANTGTVYLGGFQLEDREVPSSYVKTTTVAVTRNAEVLYWPVGFLPQGLSIYGCGYSLGAGWGQAGAPRHCVWLGDATPATPNFGFFDSGLVTGQLSGGWNSGAASSTTGDSAPISPLQKFEFRIDMTHGGIASMSYRIADGVEVAVVSGSAASLTSPWSSQRLYVANMALQRLRILPSGVSLTNLAGSF